MDGLAWPEACSGKDGIVSKAQVKERKRWERKRRQIANRKEEERGRKEREEIRRLDRRLMGEKEFEVTSARMIEMIQRQAQKAMASHMHKIENTIRAQMLNSLRQMSAK